MDLRKTFSACNSLGSSTGADTSAFAARAPQAIGPQHVIRKAILCQVKRQPWSAYPLRAATRTMPPSRPMIHGDDVAPIRQVQHLPREDLDARAGADLADVEWVCLPFGGERDSPMRRLKRSVNRLFILLRSHSA